MAKSKAKAKAKSKSNSNLEPMADRVLIRPIEEEETRASGIVLPESAKEKPQRGKILALGPGRMEDGKRVAMDVKKGDTVLFAKYAGTELKMDDDKLLILAEKDILAKVVG